MALAEFSHHAAPRGQTMARAGEWVRDALHGRVPEEPTSQELKILDNSLPDVEQVIEVPKIILHQVPQRAVPREPQLAEQFVEVPVPSFDQCTRWPSSDMTVAAGGACSRGLRLDGSRGGWCGPTTSRGPPRLGSPPAQGGI